MATTRAENKAKTAEAKADDKTTTDDTATQEQTNTGSDEQTKAASADSSTGDTATQDIATAEDQSGHTSEDIEDVLDADAPEWAASAPVGADLTPVVDGLVSTLLAQRAEARARKDWAAADAIRDALSATGLTITDTADGARWSLERN